ncbi:phenylpyruvate tautomerase [Bathymodiolus japonicus methanotrophic gill symbiont]|uniref:phenylpyruvate tautomerase MIF-related protein n=1 Tax=Bathymodiolus japonicus methanotrophic gill symbiont TaxID=113269 RepID=UPI001B5DF420|nr:phenylpyruvate tautomerase MIF-related protein [Bathymodiolus japonicus methanotrophic gill symbiont]GFO71155.1 phenylpyruvate tautomerase [Bathymodiolus japonicus methanotrophic gill symbiont]
MPLIKLRTNVSVTDEKKPELLSELSQLLASETGKPERYVMVEIAEDRNMLFGGSSDPLAYVECKSIGLSMIQAKSLSKSISQVLDSRMQINADRVYIEFSNCPAEFWGWNGSTFG